MLMMGAALGGGLLLGSMVGSKTGERKHGYSAKSRGKSSYSSAAMGLSSAGIGAAAASSSSRPSYSSSSASHSGRSLTSSKQWNEVSQTMDHIKTALISFGMAKAKEFLGQAIPGIDQHLSDAEKRRENQGYNPGRQQGSTAPAEQFADSGAFAQGSGGSQSTNWESDMYRSSGQSGNEGASGGNSGQSGTGDYFSGTHGSENKPAGHNEPVSTL